MRLVGLTGGIGSGKSTVAAMLVDRGAALLDADLIAREVVALGGRAYQPVVERFGPSVLLPDGSLDRPALAEVVFRDPVARKDLEAITHPAIAAVMAARLAAFADNADQIVVLDIPLLAEKGRMGAQCVIVVDCPEEVALSRLVTHRGFDEGDAGRRMAAQVSRSERRSLADFVIMNDGTLERLRAEVGRVWSQLKTSPADTGDGA